jgi:hypothetical protein
MATMDPAAAGFAAADPTVGMNRRPLPSRAQADFVVWYTPSGAS